MDDCDSVGRLGSPMTEVLAVCVKVSLGNTLPIAMACIAAAIHYSVSCCIKWGGTMKALNSTVLVQQM